MTDVFRTRKLVHVKLDKDTHALLRAELFKAGLNMQEILAEFCRQYINKSPHAIKIAEGYVLRRNKYKLLSLEEKAKSNVSKPLVEYDFTDADRDAIYDLLDEASPLHETDKIEEDDA